MYKILITFIISILLISFCIGQCNEEDSYYDETEDYIENVPAVHFKDAEEQQPSNTSSQPNIVSRKKYDFNSEPETYSDENNTKSQESSDVSINSIATYDNTSIEIPSPLHDRPEQILVREGYTTSYNNHTKNANWVAWHLKASHATGRWSRKGIPYIEDLEAKGGRQELDDWKYHSLSIDHGHLCPAGDCKWSKKAMVQSFLLTNMCPQNSALNQGDWEKLESRCRGWAKQYNDIYIVAGPIFYSDDYVTIGRNKVGVPDAFFKVVLCLTKKPKALGFIYPNEGNHHKMGYYVVTVDEVEEKTGIDFFSSLPDNIEDAVESVSELNKW